MVENGQKFDVEVVSPLESDKLVEMAQAAEKRIEAVKKIKTMALRLTNAHDWTDQGGKPYLQVSGSEKIARLFGISWRFIGDIERKDEGDGHFSFEVPMEFVMQGATIQFRGSRSSKDPFFSRKGVWNEEKREKVMVDIPPTEIDRADVVKAAITNTIGNGITRLLGIRNLTWKDLEDAGIKQEDVGKVEYRSRGGQPAGTGQVGGNAERLDKLLKEKYGTDEAKYKIALEVLTSFKSKDGKIFKGRTSIQGISDKAADISRHRFEEWLKKNESCPGLPDCPQVVYLPGGMEMCGELPCIHKQEK